MFGLLTNTPSPRWSPRTGTSPLTASRSPPARQVNPAQALEIRVPGDGYVPRSSTSSPGPWTPWPRGLALTVRRRRCLDAGPPRGFFTDALRRGAAHVTAVDAGYGQLACPSSVTCGLHHKELDQRAHPRPGRGGPRPCPGGGGRSCPVSRPWSWAPCCGPPPPTARSRCSRSSPSSRSAGCQHGGVVQTSASSIRRDRPGSRRPRPPPGVGIDA